MTVSTSADNTGASCANNTFALALDATMGKKTSRSSDQARVTASIDFSEIRRRVVVALFSDDVLMNRLVLKGGSALELVHRVVVRGSLDVDCSIDGEFEDEDDTKQRMKRSLDQAFGGLNLEVFDFSFERRPSQPHPDSPDHWGGYQAKFKLISKTMARSFGDDLDAQRRNALLVGPANQRVFSVDISKYEYCTGKESVVVDGSVVYVYTLEMIVAEKLRAICQQMDDYPFGNKSARARDFYDIREIVTKRNLDLGSTRFREMLVSMFEAKDVPPRLLGLIPETRDFHSTDWPQVVTAAGLTRDADFNAFFDYVELVVLPQLKSLWEIESP